MTGRSLAKPVAMVLALGSAAALAGCIVIPLNPDGTPAYGTVSSGVPPVVAAPAAVTLAVRLYPTNEAAVATGVLAGSVTNHLSGKGSFALNMGAETLSGEATRTGGAGSHSGVANAYGSKGSFANCQYTMNSTTQGTGRCTFGNGAIYQLHIGG